MKRLVNIVLPGSVFLIVAFGIACPGCRQDTKNKGPEKQSRLACLLQTRLDSLTGNKIVPGITLSVRFGDSINISLASGLADLEERIPMKPDAIMFSGSVGKTYVAAVALKMQEMGLIDISEKAARYLGNCEWFTRVPNHEMITVEMLLNHTAGVPEYAGKKELWQYLATNPDKVWKTGEQLSYIAGEPQANVPGQQWNYSDSHYLIAGAVIESVTGRKYYDILKEMILEPCSLLNTFPADRRMLPGLVPGYTSLTEDFMLPHKMLNNGVYAFNPQMEWTGGGLVSTVSDLTSWIRQLYAGDILTDASKKLMLAPSPLATTLFEDAGYGLGCFIGETDGVRYYGHTGFAPGYITFVQYLPDYDVAIAMQFNDDSSHTGHSMKIFFNTIKKDVLSNPGSKPSSRSSNDLQP